MILKPEFYLRSIDNKTSYIDYQDFACSSHAAGSRSRELFKNLSTALNGILNF